MIKRIIFLIHWATLLGVVGFTIVVGDYIAGQGIQRAGTDWVVWAGIFGPLAVFYLIDYIINGKITWLPWDREK